MSLTNRADRPANDRCMACDRPLAGEGLHEKGRLDEPLVFCDARCREDYFAGLSATEGEDEDREAA